MTQQEFIAKWKINKGLLASRLGLSSMTFLNRYKKPTPEDEAKLVAILSEMLTDLNKVQISHAAEKLHVNVEIDKMAANLDFDFQRVDTSENAKRG